MPGTAAQRRHADHEMSQALAISRHIRLRFSSLPQFVRSAIRTAYAAHFRALLEFLNDGKPRMDGGVRHDPPDIVASDFIPKGVENPNRWTVRERRRFAAADKTVAHLSQQRTRRHHARREWGDAEDDELILRKIRRFIAVVPRAERWFPRTVAELQLRDDPISDTQFLQDLLFEYGAPITSYAGTGTITAETMSASVGYAAAQYGDGRMLLAAQGDPLLFGVAMRGPTGFRGITQTGMELTARGDFHEVEMLKDTPPWASGSWVVLRPSVLSASHEATGPPQTVRYLLTNFVFDGVGRGEGIDLELPGEQADVTLTPIDADPYARQRLNVLKDSHSTAVLAVSGADAPSETRRIANYVTTLLSIARGTKIQWIGEDLVNAAGQHTRRLHYDRVTKRFSSFAPIDPIRIGGTKAFLESTYETYGANRKEYRLDAGTVDAVLDAKVEGDYLELRGAKLVVALELLKHNVLESRGSGTQHIVSARKFEAATDELSGLIRHFALDKEWGKQRAETISSAAKVRGLNRRSFARLLQRVAKRIDLQIAYRDVRLLVKCRNSLVHRGDFYCITATAAERQQVPPMDSRFEEYVFLIGFLDAFLLRLVGYRGPFLARTAASEWEERIV